MAMLRTNPIAYGKVTPHGAYLYRRPGNVIHRGLDIGGKQGTAVVAPAPGVVVETQLATVQPWTGYAPIVLLRDLEGWYHLLAHTVPTVAAGARVEAGQLVGVTGPENHTHWEVRRRRAGGSELQVDPLSWGAGRLGVNTGGDASSPPTTRGNATWPLAILLIWTLSARRSPR